MSYPRIEDHPPSTVEHVAWCTWCDHPGVVSIAGYFGDGADHELCRNCGGLGTVRREKPLREDSAWVFACHNPRPMLVQDALFRALPGMLWRIKGNMRTRRISVVCGRAATRTWGDPLEPTRDDVLDVMHRLDVKRLEVLGVTGVLGRYAHLETWTHPDNRF